MQARTKARAWALRVLYAWESRQDTDLEVVLDEFMTRRLIAADRRDYLRRLVTTLWENRVDVDRTIADNLTNWRMERLGVIDRNILRLAVTEMLFVDDVPPRVCIQEALRLADRYGTDQSPRFVNGVLDAIMKRQDGE